MRKAVIDVGSNSVLLTVEEFVGETWRPLFESSEVTGLGEGTKTSGILGEEGMARTLAAIKRAFEKAASLGVPEPVAAATMAARIATNTPVFIERAMEQGTPLFVLSGEDEAKLGFLSVATDPEFSRFERLSLIDPGGQSTELVTAEHHLWEDSGWRTLFQRSFPIGTLAMRSDAQDAERFSPGAIIRAVQETDDAIGLCYLPDQAGRVVTVGATGTNLVSIRERMPKWQPEKVHGAYLDYEEVSKAFGWLSAMTDAQRAAVVGIEPGREKTLHLGALILERFLHAVKAPGCYVSVRGWRHALLEGGLPSKH